MLFSVAEQLVSWISHSSFRVWKELAVGASRSSVRNVGELIAAVPALLGFYPENSVVLVACAPPPEEVSRHQLQVDAVMRADLGSCLDRNSIGIPGTVRVCLSNNVSHVAVLVVDEALRAATSELGKACREFLARLHIALSETDIELVGAWFTPVIHAREYWWSFWTLSTV
ncbi:DUF4192 family protein [Nocardia macrotermitis]|uniref:DUF4192 family protein n=1 Tax=Nocardia macrotermitis TaxID=2585198 RepID=UPI0018860D08|nr:DUF4192 family protein [Nocardia macrotermitis]